MSVPLVLTLPASAGGISFLHNLLKEQAMLEHLRNRFDYWRAYRRTVYELTGLDRHMLADMGLDRPTLRDIKARAKAAAKEACL